MPGLLPRHFFCLPAKLPEFTRPGPQQNSEAFSALLKYVKNKQLALLFSIFDIWLDLKRWCSGFFNLKAFLVHEEKEFLVNYCFDDGSFAGCFCNAIVLHQGIL